MANTALRAENSNSRTITFKSKEHEKFYEEYLEKCSPNEFKRLFDIVEGAVFK